MKPRKSWRWSSQVPTPLEQKLSPPGVHWIQPEIGDGGWVTFPDRLPYWTLVCTLLVQLMILFIYFLNDIWTIHQWTGEVGGSGLDLALLSSHRASGPQSPLLLLFHNFLHVHFLSCFRPLRKRKLFPKSYPNFQTWILLLVNFPFALIIHFPDYPS
jgi:hypothetical protein